MNAQLKLSPQLVDNLNANGNRWQAQALSAELGDCLIFKQVAARQSLGWGGYKAFQKPFASRVSPPSLPAYWLGCFAPP